VAHSWPGSQQGGLWGREVSLAAAKAPLPAMSVRGSDVSAQSPDFGALPGVLVQGSAVIWFPAS